MGGEQGLECDCDKGEGVGGVQSPAHSFDKEGGEDTSKNEQTRAKLTGTSSLAEENTELLDFDGVARVVKATAASWRCQSQ